MTVQIEVVAPEIIDSDDDREDTVSEASSQEDDYAIVLQYDMEKVKEMFQTLTIEKQQLEKKMQAEVEERVFLEDKNEALKKKLQSANSTSSGSRSEEPRKRYRAVRGERVITSGVLDLDDNAVYRDIDYVEGDEPAYRSCEVGTASEYIDDEDEPVYRDAGVVCPVALDIETSQFGGTSKSEELRQVILPNESMSASSHKRTSSQPQPELHIFRKIKDDNKSGSSSAEAWKDDIQKSLDEVKKMNADVKKTVEETVQQIDIKGKQAAIEEAETESDDDDDLVETDPKVQEILLGLAGNVKKNESATVFLAKKVAVQEKEIANLKAAVRRLTEYIVQRDNNPDAAKNLSE